MPPELHFEPAKIDLGTVVCDKEAIRVFLPQRGAMEHLDAVVHIDPERHLVIGYKDVRSDEFWVGGHIPGYPLLPGVIMCEAAAQLCSFYVLRNRLVISDFIGFAGMEHVRFRTVVRPGDRLVLVGKGLRIKPRQMLFNVQGFVGTVMAFEADVLGMSLPRPGEGPS